MPEKKNPEDKSKDLRQQDQAQVLQTERLDFIDLAQGTRVRTQSLDGFDEEYADIVDYIVRCTHRIWEEKNVGLIYSHYTNNCVVYSAMGTTYDREDVVSSTTQRIVSMPDRSTTNHVIWRGDDRVGFYTSHLLTATGRHTQAGPYGPPTGRMFATRTIADCMVFRNRIYREWLVGDSMAVVLQLGLDPHAIAERAARALKAKGQTILDFGDSARLNGLYPPEARPDTGMAHTELEASTLEWLHRAFNGRMFGTMRDQYAPNALYHGPLMAELAGINAIIYQWMGIFGSLPDASYTAQHVCSSECAEGGTKVAVRWTIEGHHTGYGILSALGEPSQRQVRLMGISHYHYKQGKIVDEWTVYDQMSLLVQIKLAGDHPLNGSFKCPSIQEGPELSLGMPGYEFPETSDRES